MSVVLDDLQQMVVDSFGGFFDREVPPSRVRAADETSGFDERLWTAFIELGGTRVALHEAFGGLGGSFLDAVLIAIEAGRRLAPIPYSDVVAALRLVGRLGFDEGDLPQGADSRCIVVRPGCRPDGAPGALSSAGAAADVAIVVADGRATAIPVDGVAIQREPVANLGRLPMAWLRIDDLPSTPSRAVDTDALERWRADLRLLDAALLVGAGRHALDLALDHVKSRVQFGRPIGSFQALQHRLADRATDVEAALLLTVRAAAFDERDPSRSYFAATALHAAATAGELAGKEALQMFGGYGYSLEYDVHLYLRFLKARRVLSWDAEVVDDALPAAARRTGVSGG